MEIRDGSIKDLNMWKFIQFLLFFPTISSGPIDRYRRFIKDYDRVPDPEHYAQLVTKAMHYLMLGFLYKFILGYIFGTLWLPSVEHMAMVSRTGAFLGLSWPVVGVMYAYSFYLFFDFAGYSLFAVAISYLMGIETPMNFNKPWMSYNIKHKLIKSRIWTAFVGYLVLFLIMGIWHGETWYYITYGLFHAMLINLTDAWLRFKKKHKDFFPHNKATHYFAIFMTANAVCFSFLIFSGFLDTL